MIWACDHQTSGLFNKRWGITPTMLRYNGIDLDVGGTLKLFSSSGESDDKQVAFDVPILRPTRIYICVCVCLCR